MRKSVLLGLGALVAVSALFLACGGSDDKDGASNDADGNSDSVANVAGLQNLQVSKGLSVANLSQNGGIGSDDASAESAGVGGSGAPAPAADGSARSAGGSYGVGGSTGGDTVSSQQTGTTDNTGITVQGYGSATADADSAIVEFGFSSTGNGGVTPLPYPEGDIRPEGSAEPITRETLQPVIDALVAAGVSNDDIELLSQSYYYDYYSSYATLRATVNDLAILDGAVNAAQDAANDISSVYLNSTNIIYTLQNCEALERAAAEAAVEDAGDRAAVLADVLDVTLGEVAGASDYSWYGSGTGCGNDYYSPWPIAYTPWRVGGNGDGTVQVVSNISVTYAFS